MPSGNRRRQAQLFPIKQNGVLRPAVSAGGAALPRNSSQISKSQACVDMGQGEIRQRNGDQGRKPATFRPYRVRCSAIHGYCLRALLVRTKLRSVFAAAPPAGTFLPFPCRILRVQGGARKLYREAAPIGVNNSSLSKPQACVTLPSGNRRRQAQTFQK